MHSTQHRSVVEPPERVSFEEWYKEFNISRLHRAQSMNERVLADETAAYAGEYERETDGTAATDNLLGKLLNFKNRIHGTSK
jgi:hypothetical protein